MFIRRHKYEAQIRRAIDETRAEMRETLAQAAADVQRIAEDAIKRAEARVTSLEQTLAAERRQHARDLRHFASMWLRHNKSMPLPQTPEEKVEAKAAVEEQKKQPVPLTDIQIAMREANRREAARYGVSEEQADKDFEQKILSQMMET